MGRLIAVFLVEPLRKHLHLLPGKPCRRAMGVGRGQAQVIEDLLDHARVADEREHEHGGATTDAGQSIDMEDAHEQAGPCAAAGLWRRRRVARGPLEPSTRGRRIEVRDGRRGRRQAGTVPGAVGEDAVIAHQVGIGIGDERAETFCRE